MPVRVVRIMEYSYQTQEDADADMSRWNAPANGIRSFDGRTLIRCATLHPETIFPIISDRVGDEDGDKV